MQCFASESRFESAAPDAAELASSLFHSLDTHLRQLLCHIYSLRSFPLGSQVERLLERAELRREHPFLLTQIS